MKKSNKFPLSQSIISVRYSIVVLFLISFYTMSGQNIIPIRTLDYRAWITLTDSQDEFRGMFKEVKDSSVTLAKPVNSSSMYYNDYPKEIPVERIKNIRLRKYGRVGKGFGIGFLSGFAAGFIIGAASGDGNYISAESQGLMLGIPIALLGGGIGAAIGSAKITIPINGDMNVFKSSKKELRQYTKRKF